VDNQRHFSLPSYVEMQIQLFHWKSLYQVRAITVSQLWILDLVCLWTMVLCLSLQTRAFVAVKADGSIAAWGSSSDGSTMPPNLGSKGAIV
jgi:hypothetical protein